MKFIHRIVAFILGATVASRVSADTLYSQPPTSSGTVLLSSYWDPDGSDYDEFVWDRFVLPAAANITEIQWRGGGSTVNEFEISIWASIPVGSQPDVGSMNGGRLLHRMTGDNAGQTFAGTFGGVAMYDHHFVLPQPFLATANVPYWVQIIAWTPSWPSWGLATATGGNGNHFHRGLAVTGDYSFYFAGGDAAFKLIGTPVVCQSPVISQQPQPVSVCFMGPSVNFAVVATGTGPFTYQWRRNDYPVNDGPNGGGAGGGATITGATTANLTIVQPSYYAQPGIYDCVVTNACGPTVSGGAQLDVALGGPSIISEPGSAMTCQGATISFATNTAGNGPIVFTWSRDGAILSNGSTAFGSMIAGATTSTLVISALQPGDQGSYTCRVSNPCSAVTTSAATLAVSPIGGGDADLNGVINGADVQSFVNFVMGSGVSEPGWCASDINQDGLVNYADVPGMVSLVLGP